MCYSHSRPASVGRDHPTKSEGVRLARNSGVPLRFRPATRSKIYRCGLTAPNYYGATFVSWCRFDPHTPRRSTGTPVSGNSTKHPLTRTVQRSNFTHGATLINCYPTFSFHASIRNRDFCRRQRMGVRPLVSRSGANVTKSLLDRRERLSGWRSFLRSGPARVFAALRLVEEAPRARARRPIEGRRLLSLRFLEPVETDSPADSSLNHNGNRSRRLRHYILACTHSLIVRLGYAPLRSKSRRFL